MDTVAHALDLLDRHRYAVLATADADGRPWATPVWFAADGLDRVLWVSWPGSRHSTLVAGRPAVALTVFDSSRPCDDIAAFYATAVARECGDDELDGAIAVYDRRAHAHGLDGFGRDGVTGDRRLRLYVADLTAAWVLDQEADVDQRVAVPLGLGGQE